MWYPFLRKKMKILHYFLYGILFFSLSALSAQESRAEYFLAPQSSFYDSEWFNPLAPDSYSGLSRGREGIKKLMEMFNSEIGQTLFHDALARRNIRVDFSHFHSQTGANYLVADVYPTSPDLQDIFKKIIREKLHARILGDVTDIKEESLGKIMILIGKQGEASVPLIWEIQPSTTSRLWQANADSHMGELQWRKHVTRALARFFTIMGFKDIYARSAKSIEQHPKYNKQGMDISKTQGVKQWIDPRDVALNYEQTFANRDLWGNTSSVNYELWSDIDRYYNDKNFQLHRYSKPDLLLNEKGVKFYHLFERKTKQGYKLCLGFKNLMTQEIFLFDFDDILKGVKFPLSSENSSIESITKALRFKYKVRLFEHIRPDLELKTSIKGATLQSA